MHRNALVLLVAAAILVCAGALLVPQMIGDDDPTLLRWSEKDEVDVEANDAAAAEAASTAAVDRSIVAVSDPLKDQEGRVEVLMRGRVVDKFERPVADAKVWLEFGRAGQRGGPGARQRRVPDPVQTDEQGRFAFQGQTFRNLQVSLRVRHASFAPGLFEKSVGEVGQRNGGDIELGDVVMARGAELLGRVTDLDGNGVANATVVLQPENGNRMRFVRDRDELLPSTTTDNNGWYRRPNVPAGDWSVAVTAKRHTEGRSSVFACEDEQQVEVEDVRLGPGYEVTGWVRTASGAPIAKAQVVMRSEGNDRGTRGGRDGGGGGGGRGGFGGVGGRDHRATTDAEGRFFLEHLPASPMSVDANAEGYLDAKLTGIDPTIGQPVLVSMQEGLRITGIAVDEDATPVTSFAVRAMRIRGLPTAATGQAGDGAQRAGIEATMREMRTQWEDVRQRGEGGPGGPGGGQRPGQMMRDLGKTESHPRGEFVLTGLQEGIYEVHLQSNDHARYRSAEIELRAGLAAPNVTAKLDRGVYVAGGVVDSAGNPVRDAQVTLRPSSNEAPAAADAPGRGQRTMQDMARRFANALASVDTKTDADGAFVLKHVPRGTYRLQAEKDGFANASGETFELTTDRSGFTLTLGALGAIAGKVLGLGDKEIAEAHVGAVPMRRDGAPAFGMGRGGGMGGAGFRDVGVSPDGTYRIEDLEPGEYVVRAWIGSPQDLMRELMPKFFDGSLTADVVVRASEVAPLDVAITRPQVGTVAGTVLHNGSAANGFQVELTRNDTTTTTTPGANTDRGGRGGGPGGRGFNMGRTQQAAVAASGEFKIANVTAGSYRLRVMSGRRGAVLHEEPIEVVTGVTTERSIVITSCTVAGTITIDDGTDPKTLAGNLSLLPGLTTLPENLGQWRRDNSSIDARVQNGAFRFDTVSPGNYLAVLSIRGRDRTTTPLTIGPGGITSLTLPVGKVADPATIRPGANPNANNGTDPNAAPTPRPQRNAGARPPAAQPR